MKVTNTTGVDLAGDAIGGVVADGESIDVTDEVAAQLIRQGWTAKPAKTIKTTKAVTPAESSED